MATEVPKGSTIIATMSEPATASGTYAIQMTDCQTCTKNTSTINTMLTVMSQQAATLKDQQGTIANLITMLSNASGSASPSKVSEMISRAGAGGTSLTVKRGHSTKKINGLASGGDSAEEEGKTPRKRSRTKPTTVAASSAPKRKIVTNSDGEQENGMPVEFMVKNDSEGDDDTVTKIWIRGTPSEKCPCPLDECAGRKFAAADMYYLRRHFQQVHRLTHPHPVFVIQCPVDDCGAEFEASLRDMRKHLAKDHSDMAFPRSSPRKKGQAASPEEEMGDELEDGGEDAEAAAELASEDD